MTLVVAAKVVAATALSLAGLLVVWRAWHGERMYGQAMAVMLAAWSVSTGLWISGFGAEIGTALALESGSLLAFAFLLTRIERQPARTTREREPATSTSSTSPARRWRAGVAYVLLAGPLAFATALSIGLLVALEAPFHEQTRLIIGGLAVPSLWAGMMITIIALRRPIAITLTFTLVIGMAAMAILVR